MSRLHCERGNSPVRDAPLPYRERDQRHRCDLDLLVAEKARFKPDGNSDYSS